MTLSGDVLVSLCTCASVLETVTGRHIPCHFSELVSAVLWSTGVHSHLHPLLVAVCPLGGLHGAQVRLPC